VVNVVCILQAIGFATRGWAPQVEPILWAGIAASAIPATYALWLFARERSRLRFVIGPIVFDVFVVYLLALVLVAGIDWRDPANSLVRVVYFALFFGSIVLMGWPMVRIDTRRANVTAVSVLILVGALLYAQGVA
jgi:hypothetical protein